MSLKSSGVSLFLALCVVVGPIGFSGLALGQPPLPSSTVPESEAEQRRADLRRQFMVNACGKFEMQIGEPDQFQIAKMIPEPVLRWNNPIATVADGIIVVYARNERPDVIGQFHIHNNRFVVNEFSRVCAEPLRMNRWGRTVWNPGDQWTEFRLLPEGQQPANTPELRLAQMRQLASRFSILDQRDGKVETASVLRLMPQPVYRYRNEPGLIDGAMFLFAIGVDSQAALLLEARTDDKNQQTWHYAFASVTIYELTASLGDQVVWQKPRVTTFASLTYPYYAGPYRPDPDDLRIDDIMPAEAGKK